MAALEIDLIWGQWDNNGNPRKEDVEWPQKERDEVTADGDRGKERCNTVGVAVYTTRG